MFNNQNTDRLHQKNFSSAIKTTLIRMARFCVRVQVLRSSSWASRRRIDIDVVLWESVMWNKYESVDGVNEGNVLPERLVLHRCDKFVRVSSLFGGCPLGKSGVFVGTSFPRPFGFYFSFRMCVWVLIRERSVVGKLVKYGKFAFGVRR